MSKAVEKEIEKLEERLDQLREDKIADENKRRINNMKKLVGTGKCTHVINSYMTSSRDSYNFVVYFIDDVVIRENVNRGEPVYKIRTAEFLKDGDKLQVKLDKTTYNERPPTWMGHFKYDISSQEFEKIYKVFYAGVEATVDKLRQAWKVEGEMISSGDYRAKRTSTQYLEDRGHTFIDLKEEDPLVWQSLNWQHHPFIYKDGLMLNTTESLQIARDIAKKLESDARSWGGSIAERDLPRSEAILKFANKHLN